MQYQELEEYYLCGIGYYGKINNYQVGTFDKSRNSFKFSNGHYEPIELSLEPRGSNACYVVKAICLQDIDDVISIMKDIKE